MLGIDLFSASMRAWRCSAMRMVFSDAQEMTAPETAIAMMMANPRPARSTVEFIAVPAGAAFRPLACIDQRECTRLHQLGNRISGRSASAAVRSFNAGTAGEFSLTSSCIRVRKWRNILKIRLGIIGAGLKAADYARGWTTLPDVEITAVAEIDPPS